jgi:CRISPR/Cas system CSM-associated protein Csm3 (group 7 of RAMP superfamily)
MPKDDFLKDYIRVNDRILKFYDKYPDGSIETELILTNDERVVVKAYAYKNKDDSRPSTGHAEEFRNSNYINRTSAVENCETSAVGRALANLGFEIKQNIASREEVERALEKQEFLNNPDVLAAEKGKKEIFDKAKKKGLATSSLKDICQDITNKASSKNWTLQDIQKIDNYINSIDTH